MPAWVCVWVSQCVPLQAATCDVWHDAVCQGVDPCGDLVAWRMSDANGSFQLCPTYPTILCVPRDTSDAVLALAAKSRSKVGGGPSPFCCLGGCRVLFPFSCALPSSLPCFLLSCLSSSRVVVACVCGFRAGFLLCVGFTRAPELRCAGAASLDFSHTMTSACWVTFAAPPQAWVHWSSLTRGPSSTPHSTLQRERGTLWQRLLCAVVGWLILCRCRVSVLFFVAVATLGWAHTLHRFESVKQLASRDPRLAGTRIHFMDVANIHAVRRAFLKMGEACRANKSPGVWWGAVAASGWLDICHKVLVAADSVAHLLEHKHPVLVHCRWVGPGVVVLLVSGRWGCCPC